MSALKSVCVYCGASNNVSDVYKNAGQQLGQKLAEHKSRLIYGGGSVGIMGIVADAVMDSGGEVTGIIPKFLDDYEVGHQHLTELIITENMHERKNLMAEKAESFVVLPGGLGTLEEFFEMVTWKQLGLHDKPIVIFNVNGFWDALVTLIDHQISEKFAREENRSLFTVATTVDEIIEQLETAPTPSGEVASKWT
ncbi:LOG family protein [Curvivirga aplysinae]|uniref:LOG family protein n=1 Tax=Curvivirga aplysinae TaxID=2529852 RepID=UPI0012BC56F1|nr:TIGR00730 family Rossman fold protein [Curvivirga aplysinae]MTI09035.1 TIGR00730 family Rossman fold protein [Curvivirga aplysinae]